MLSFVLNGQPLVVPDPAPETTLLDFLRGRGLTGAKEGCAEGECGACAVVLVSPRAGAASFEAVNSCLMFLPMAAGREIYTVEALAPSGVMSSAQAAMAAAGASQCGYCTPGFVMALVAEQYRVGREGPCDPLALAGNLCRCTGYRPIRDAALSLGPAPAGPFLDRLARSVPALTTISCDGFVRPDTIDACVALLTTHTDAKVVSGGTDLGVESNLQDRRPPLLVSLEAVDELRTFSIESDRVVIGAALPLAEIDRLWHDAPPAVRAWLTRFGSPMIRNRATLGGNLGTASPIGDGAPLLLALDAVVHAAGPRGRRRTPIAEFFRGYRDTVLARDEIITAIELPLPLPRTLAFYKVAKRHLDDISTVAAALAVDSDDRGRVTRARFCFGGVAPVPLRVTQAESAVAGAVWDEAAVHRVQQVLDATLTPLSDHRGSREYRLEVSKALVHKFWWEHRT